MRIIEAPADLDILATYLWQFMQYQYQYWYHRVPQVKVHSLSVSYYVTSSLGEPGNEAIYTLELSNQMNHVLHVKTFHAALITQITLSYGTLPQSCRLLLLIKLHHFPVNNILQLSPQYWYHRVPQVKVHSLSVSYQVTSSGVATPEPTWTKTLVRIMWKQLCVVCFLVD